MCFNNTTEKKEHEMGKNNIALACGALKSEKVRVCSRKSGIDVQKARRSNVLCALNGWTDFHNSLNKDVSVAVCFFSHLIKTRSSGASGVLGGHMSDYEAAFGVTVWKKDMMK